MPFGVQFDSAVSIPTTDSNRTDIGCFVGFLRKRAGSLPSWLRAFLVGRGFLDAPGARPAAEITALLHVPVPISSFATFDALFDWQNPEDGVTYLGAAVRSFFAQGGRTCFVVRTGDPIALDSARSLRLAALNEVVPHTSSSPVLSPHDSMAWRGIAHLHGLQDAVFVCVPDLPWLVGQILVAPPQPPNEERQAEFFVDCVTPPAPLPALPPPQQALPAPRLVDESGYLDWSGAVHRVADFLRRYRKDVQLIAAVPLPHAQAEANTDVLGWLLRLGVLATLDGDSLHGLSSSFIQLVYPWLKMGAASGLPEGLEPPDGAIAGVLARSALLRGAFASAAGEPVYQLQGVYPELSVAHRSRPHPPTRVGQEPRFSLQERVSLVGQTLDGFQLLSDNTLSIDEAWRPASSHRLMSIWVRALQRLGEAFVFEASNEALWDQIRSQLSFVGDSLFRQGGLRGANALEAFEVRCDSATMTTHDIDNGRLIAEILYRPAMPIEQIRVSLVLKDSQQSVVFEESVA